MKYCPEIFSSSRVSKDGWYTVEPNTGVMHIRSTPQSIKFYQNWLQRIVNSNVMNDQKEFDRIGTRATYTSNCNGGNFATARLHENSASFCFLQEILFQNGMVGVQCYAKQVHRANWIVEMYEHATPIEVSIVKKDFNYSRISRFPILLHVNYCNSKSHELGVRGLWLVKDGNNLSCDSYNINQTWYASFDWEKEVSSIRSNWAQELTNVLVNGTLLKVVGRKEVYVIDELLRKRFIPDKETFQYMNFDWGRMKTIPLRVMNNITEGDPVLIEPQLLYKEEMSKLLSNGTLVRCNGNSSVFVAENFSLREIPDKSTFLSNGFDWKKVQVISKDVFRLMPIGSSLPSSMKT